MCSSIVRVVPMGAPGMAVVTLREVTDENRPAVLALSVASAQERFVGTVARALRDAEEIPEGKPWYRAIYADDQPVGFLMLSWNVTPDPPRIIASKPQRLAALASRRRGLSRPESQRTPARTCSCLIGGNEARS